MARAAGDLDPHLGKRQHIERARAMRPHLAKPLAQLGARGLLPRPALAQQAVAVKVDTPQGSAQGLRPGYLQHGKGLEGRDAELYGPGSADPQRFHQQQRQDTHRFTLVVMFDDHGGVDRTAFIEQYMQRVEHDLGTRLDWLAANHYDTTHPHTHLVVRGQAEDGSPLYLKKGYYMFGLRERAQELLTQYIGRVDRTAREQAQQVTLAREHAFAQELSRLDGMVRGPGDPDVYRAPAPMPQRVYGHDGMAAHVERLWTQMQAQEQRRQQDQARSWGRER